MFTAFWRVFVTMVTASTAVTPAQLCQCFHMCCGKYCGKVLVCLMLLLTVCSASNSNKDQRTCNRGTITPAEPYFLEGEDIVLMCNRKKGPSKHLTFVRGQNSTLVPDKYIQQFNDTAIKMVIPNITAEDIDASSPFTQYRCIHTGNKKKRCYDNVYVRLEFLKTSSVKYCGKN
ncbi:uncharacterized protein LOC128555541 isoform X1 [Mercenaria mercenaria]|uniref:uncharacterized protein LOC128555541 isoform X1 n=1 Tax=Mercenaria mercenaria TaxID=6596 RepID=UPI00234F2FA7|nr:uncharacterized protein LOC128555541 isoform X1 [Mercenaria mercenaria]